MQAVISNSLIKKLKPAEKPYEVRDTRLKGFLLRVQPSGVMTFYVEYGRGKRIAIGRADAVTPTQARDGGKAILAAAYQGGDPMATRRQAKAHTLASFIEEIYAPWAETNIRTSKATVARLKANFPDLQKKKLANITPWLVEKWRSARLKTGAKPSTVNRDLTDLKSSLAKAVSWGLLDAYPLANVKRSKVDTSPATRFLTNDEEISLRAALDDREERIRQERDNANAWREERGYDLLPDLRVCIFADHLKPLVLLSLNTGLRRGELFSLMWDDVDLAQGNLTVHGAKAKGGKTRHMPLNAEAQMVLEGWKAQAPDAHQGLVFPGKNGGQLDNVRKSWAGVMRASGITRFRWHDMRHTFASRLVMHGVDLNTVRELLGHSDYKMTLRYAHLAPEHKAAAVARLVGARP